MIIRSHLLLTSNYWASLLMIDLNFRKHISNIIKKVNPKLYLYKKLFYLPLSVKIQFFKSFNLPYFDYCSTLIIYYPTLFKKYIPSFYLSYWFLNWLTVLALIVVAGSLFHSLKARFAKKFSRCTQLVDR